MKLSFTWRNIFLIETASLWHDMALNEVTDRASHGEQAGELFLQTFPDDKYFNEDEKETICFILKYHDKANLVRNSESDLRLLHMLNIVTDADTIELLGERGFERAVEVVKANGWPVFNPSNPRGDTFGFSSSQFDERFLLKSKGQIDYVKEPTLVGQLNFQISCADNLKTKKGGEIGMPRAEYLRNKLDELINQKAKILLESPKK